VSSPTGSVDTPRHQSQQPGEGIGTASAVKTSWGFAAALIILSLIPVIAGSLRLLEIAGTQTFTQGVGEGLSGTSALSTAVSVSAGWVINAIVAEWVVRRPSTRRTRRARAEKGLVYAR
jgi:hypothetical protein